MKRFLFVMFAMNVKISLALNVQALEKKVCRHVLNVMAMVTYSVTIANVMNVQA